MTALVRTLSGAVVVTIAGLVSAHTSRGYARATTTTRTCDLAALGAAVAIDTSRLMKSSARFVSSESSEGGMVTAYTDANTVRALVLTFFGEQGRAVSRYYLTQSGDFVLIQEELRYAAPLSMEQSPRIVSRLPQIGYWCGGKLLRQLPDNSLADAKQALDSALALVHRRTK